VVPRRYQCHLHNSDSSIFSTLACATIAITVEARQSAFAMLGYLRLKQFLQLLRGATCSLEAEALK